MEESPVLVYCSDCSATAPERVSRRARITRKGVLTYVVREGSPGNPEALALGRDRLLANGYNGTFSRKAKSRVRRVAETWLYGRTAQAGDVWSQVAADAASRKYVLLTATLPAAQAHSDQEVRRLMLMPFLQQLKRKHGLVNYMWFAERQGNGNIHFHIVADRYMEAAAVRKLWNAALERRGYIERYRAGRQAWHAGGFRYDAYDGQGRSQAQQLRAYQEGVRTNWSNPPTTDIRQVQGADAVLAYVIEYCAKGTEAPEGSVLNKLEGRLWGCNTGLEQLERYEVEMTPELDVILRAGAENGTLREVEGERWTYYAGNIGEQLRYDMPWLYLDFQAHWRREALKLPSRRALRRSKRAARDQRQSLPAHHFKSRAKREALGQVRAAT